MTTDLIGLFAVIFGAVIFGAMMFLTTKGDSK